MFPKGNKFVVLILSGLDMNIFISYDPVSTVGELDFQTHVLYLETQSFTCITCENNVQ